MIGVGPGGASGYVVSGSALVLVTCRGFLIGPLRRFGTGVPDSLPDGLVGVRQRNRKPHLTPPPAPEPDAR